MPTPEPKSDENTQPAQSVSTEVIRDIILQMVENLDLEKSVDPPEIARALVGTNEKAWRTLMKPIRREAIALAREDRLLILRKGKPVDPDNFKGVYRIGQAK